MNASVSDWLLLSYEHNHRLTESICQLHHSVQFIAIAGKYLIREEPGDSHTNMHWDPERLAFIGKKIEAPVPFRVALQSRNMNLIILDDNETEISSLHLPGATKGYAFAWLKEQVAGMGADHTLLKNKMHYSIPKHAIDTCGPFRIGDPEAFRELARQRTNAGRVLKALSGKVSDASPIAVWPHHFDTGMIIPAKRDAENEPVMSFGAGYAIPDEYSEQPYFYLSVWSRDDLPATGKLPALKNGFWIDKDWKGAILKTGELNKTRDPIEQKEAVIGFYVEAIEAASGFFKTGKIFK